MAKQCIPHRREICWEGTIDRNPTWHEGIIVCSILLAMLSNSMTKQEFKKRDGSINCSFDNHNLKTKDS